MMLNGLAHIQQCVVNKMKLVVAFNEVAAELNVTGVDGELCSLPVPQCHHHANDDDHHEDDEGEDHHDNDEDGDHHDDDDEKREVDHHDNEEEGGHHDEDKDHSEYNYRGAALIRAP